MAIFVIGINHKTATIELREKVYFALDKLALYLQDISNRGLAREAVLLSTCNRSELYCEADDANLLREWFCQQTLLPEDEINSALYIYRDQDAVTHIMQVACGLDSMILGEPQILGQVKEAFSESCTAGTVGTLFQRLFQQVFRVAKDIRATTAIGACPVSVASAAVHFAKLQSIDLSKAKVVLIGAGDTTELLLRYLKPQLTISPVIVNRSYEKAQELAGKFDCRAYGLEQLHSVLSEADMVFSATGSALPIVTKDMVQKVMEQRAHSSLIFIDIAVPRDIEANVAELPHVALYCIDDLKAIIEKNRQGREHGAVKAREMVQQKSAEFMLELQSFDHVSHMIRAYRGQIEDICQTELLKARDQIKQGIDPVLVLESFAQAYTKKLLHEPSVQLRQAGVEGRFELLRLAKRLFAIPDTESEML